MAVINSCVAKLVEPLAGIQKLATYFTNVTADMFSDFRSKCKAFETVTSNDMKGGNSLSVAEQATDSTQDLNCNDL